MNELTPDFNGAPSHALARCAVVLSHTSHPGNIGAVARAMKTMGLVDLRLVNPERFPDPVASARASGATDILDGATIFASVAEALADCHLVIGTSARGRDFVGEVQPLRAAAEHAWQRVAAQPEARVAWLFGAETSGLTNAEVAICQSLAFIPANPAYSSLNLAAAVQVVAYEMRVAAELVTGHSAPVFELASQKQIHDMMAHARQTMIALRFLNPEVPKRLLPRLSRLFARTRLEREEVDIFRGLLRSIDNALAKKP